MATHRWDHHPPCPGGCNNLADECECPRPNPLGSMRLAEPIGSHYLTTRKPECRCQIIAPARRERGSGVLIEPPEWEQADDCPVHPTTRAGEPA